MWLADLWNEWAKVQESIKKPYDQSFEFFGAEVTGTGKAGHVESLYFIGLKVTILKSHPPWDLKDGPARWASIERLPLVHNKVERSVTVDVHRPATVSAIPANLRAWYSFGYLGLASLC